MFFFYKKQQERPRRLSYKKNTKSHASICWGNTYQCDILNYISLNAENK